MSTPSPLDQLRQLAPQIEGIDLDCYRRHGRDPAEPVLGLGPASAPWCFFGRDPGEQEVRLQRPFVGDAGRKIRAAMEELGLGDEDVYWMNTVPFKPLGNKAWAMRVRRLCRPPLLRLLAAWGGTNVITFGEAAFKWFGLDSPEVRTAIEQFWRREDKSQAQLAIPLAVPGGVRRFTLCPVPHPSGANAVWSSRFPGLLRARLRDTWPAARSAPP